MLLCHRADYQTCYKVVLTSLIYNHGITRMLLYIMTVSDVLEHLATSLIASTRLLQVANSLFQTY